MAKKAPWPPAPKKPDPKAKASKGNPSKGNCPDCGKPMSLHKGGKCPK